MSPNPIIVALDVDDERHALDLVDRLAPHVGAFKVGKELFTRLGPSIVHAIHERRGQVFLDLKFHDIPNTVACAVRAAADLGVAFLTVHTSGGPAMLEAACEAARTSGGRPPLVLGVTILTSLDADDLARIGMTPDVGRQVERLARLAVESGVPGLVCSPLELVGLRGFLPGEIRLVTPGIRPAGGSGGDDQKRTLTPAQAMEAGADHLVIGRPIYQSPDPAEAARSILASLPDSNR